MAAHLKRPQYRDHFGTKIRKDNVVAFAKMQKDTYTDKKNAVLLAGVVIELVNHDGAPSVKIEDMATHKISHIRRLDNIVVLCEHQIEIEGEETIE